MMSEKSISYVNKSDWGDGPWQSEPDRVAWIDELTGLHCIIRRGSSGSWCGYVAVEKEHPLYEKNYNDVSLDAHGGLTYSEFCQEEDKEQGICHITENEDVAWWFGFDCAHGGDYTPAFMKPWGSVGYIPEETTSDYKDINYAKNEVKCLANQINALIRREKMRCFFIHKWGKWEQYTEQGTYVPLGIMYPKEVRGKCAEYTEKRQKRKCLICGKVQDLNIENGG